MVVHWWSTGGPLVSMLDQNLILRQVFNVPDTFSAILRAGVFPITFVWQSRSSASRSAHTNTAACNGRQCRMRMLLRACGWLGSAAYYSRRHKFQAPDIEHQLDKLMLPILVLVNCNKFWIWCC